MHSHDIAWAAGLFEGEGCITTAGNGWQLQLRMTDSDVVKRFIDVVQYGNFRREAWFDKGKRPGSKPVYGWRIGKSSEVRRILDMFLPYFGERRAYKALNALDDIELKQ